MAVINAKAVLLDIEGTTTSINFVKDVLFPYSKQHTRSFLIENWEQDETKEVVQSLVELSEYRFFNPRPQTQTVADVALITGFVNYLIDRNFKLAPLKTLQGLVWAKGYADGTLQGHVYDEVPGALKRWHEAGLTIAIYSSGSVNAQKLLFGSTVYGNLLPYINAHFDTLVGPKQEIQSYYNIAQELDIDSDDILFLTDVVAEAAAARGAGMSTLILNRSGNAPLTDDEKFEYMLVNNFDEVNVAKIV